jgi:nucleolar GTP-binding protein
VNESKRLISNRKRIKHNHPSLPRAVQRRTVSDLSSALTKAGYDPSRIEERAALLAKAAGSKRKRDEADAGMDVDDEYWENEDGDMEVDESTPHKKAKTGKAGRATLVTMVDRTAKSDRNLAGLGGPQVCCLLD